MHQNTGIVVLVSKHIDMISWRPIDDKTQEDRKPDTGGTDSGGFLGRYTPKNGTSVDITQLLSRFLQAFEN